MSTEYFKSKDELARNVKKAVSDIISRIEITGFTVIPFAPSSEMKTPAGWCTIGFTKVGIPEFYVSGIPAFSDKADDLLERLKKLHAFGVANKALIRASHLACQINDIMLDMVGPDEQAVYQYRPINAERLMYGQALLLRHWAEHEGLIQDVQGIQIVHRDDSNQFPMVSTDKQLLVDYIPFGSVPYKNIYSEESTVGA